MNSWGQHADVWRSAETAQIQAVFVWLQPRGYVRSPTVLFPAARATLTDKNKALSEDLYLNMPYKDCLGGQDYSINTDADAPS